MSEDHSPRGSPVPGILQARTLEWVAISFSNASKWKVKVKSLSRVWLFATPWTAASQAPPSMGFSRQKYWSVVPLPWIGEFWALLYKHVKWNQFCSILSIIWHWVSLGLEWKLIISSPVATSEFFKIFWHIECSTFTASSFRIWNRSTGVSSPPLALFIVMLPKAHLTSHSRKSGSRWVITQSWLSGLWRSFLYGSSVYSCHPLVISSAFFRSALYWAHLAWNIPLVSLIFLKRSLVFPILLFSSISWHWSLRKTFLSLLAILWNSACKWLYLSFSPLLLLFFFSQLFLRPPQTAILLFCISFSWRWSWSLSPVQCQKPLSIVLQALCLWDLVP